MALAQGALSALQLLPAGLRGAGPSSGCWCPSLCTSRQQPQALFEVPASGGKPIFDGSCSSIVAGFFSQSSGFHPLPLFHVLGAGCWVPRRVLKGKHCQKTWGSSKPSISPNTPASPGCHLALVPAEIVTHPCLPLLQSVEWGCHLSHSRAQTQRCPRCPLFTACKLIPV